MPTPPQWEQCQQQSTSDSHLFSNEHEPELNRLQRAGDTYQANADSHGSRKSDVQHHSNVEQNTAGDCQEGLELLNGDEDTRSHIKYFDPIENIQDDDGDGAEEGQEPLGHEADRAGAAEDQVGLDDDDEHPNDDETRRIEVEEAEDEGQVGDAERAQGQNVQETDDDGERSDRDGDKREEQTAPVEQSWRQQRGRKAEREAAWLLQSNMEERRKPGTSRINRQRRATPLEARRIRDNQIQGQTRVGAAEAAKARVRRTQERARSEDAQARKASHDGRPAESYEDEGEDEDLTELDHVQRAIAAVEGEISCIDQSLADDDAEEADLVKELHEAGMDDEGEHAENQQRLDVLFERDNHSRRSMVNAVLEANLQCAKQAELECSGGDAGVRAIGALQGKQPKDLRLWKSNTKSHEVLQPVLEGVLRRQRDAKRDRWVTNAIQYRQLHIRWRQHLQSLAPNAHAECGQSGRDGERTLDTHNKSDNGRKKDKEHSLERLRTLTRVPAVENDQHEIHAHDFPNDFGRVNDPVADAHEQSLDKVWSEAEVRVFKDKFAKDRKNFRKIANALPDRTPGECVMFYYRHQKDPQLGLRKRKSSAAQKRKDMGRIFSTTSALKGLVDAPKSNDQLERKRSAEQAQPTEELHAQQNDSNDSQNQNVDAPSEAVQGQGMIGKQNGSQRTGGPAPKKQRRQQNTGNQQLKRTASQVHDQQEDGLEPESAAVEARGFPPPPKKPRTIQPSLESLSRRKSPLNSSLKAPVSQRSPGQHSNGDLRMADGTEDENSGPFAENDSVTGEGMSQNHAISARMATLQAKLSRQNGRQGKCESTLKEFDSGLGYRPPGANEEKRTGSDDSEPRRSRRTERGASRVAGEKDVEENDEGPGSIAAVAVASRSEAGRARTRQSQRFTGVGVGSATSRSAHIPIDVPFPPAARKKRTSCNESVSFTSQEQEIFLAGLQLLGRDWRAIANYMKTRSMHAVRQFYITKKLSLGLECVAAVAAPRNGGDVEGEHVQVSSEAGGDGRRCAHQHMNEVAHEAAREEHKHELEVTDDERGEVKQEQRLDERFAGAQEVKQKERREAENMQLGRDQEGKSGDDR